MHCDGWDRSWRRRPKKAAPKSPLPPAVERPRNTISPSFSRVLHSLNPYSTPSTFPPFLHCCSLDSRTFNPLFSFNGKINHTVITAFAGGSGGKQHLEKCLGRGKKIGRMLAPSCGFEGSFAEGCELLGSHGVGKKEGDKTSGRLFGKRVPLLAIFRGVPTKQEKPI